MIRNGKKWREMLKKKFRKILLQDLHFSESLKCKSNIWGDNLEKKPKNFISSNLTQIAWIGRILMKRMCIYDFSTFGNFFIT